jgi:hypothetical protein
MKGVPVLIECRTADRRATCTSLPRTAARLVLGVLALLFRVSDTVAQCPGQWAQGSGVSGLNSTVSAAATMPNGDVVVGGSFSIAETVVVRGIARYSPATGQWTSFGSGFGPDGARITALAVFPNGDIVAGGQFSTAGGVPASNIARWTASAGAWSAMGSGTTGNVYALAALPNGDVIAGGSFTFGGLSTTGIGRWNAATNKWSALATGGQGNVHSLLALPNGDVIAGGSLSYNGLGGTVGVARWNAASNSWSALGTGLPSAIPYALALIPNAAGGDGDVIAGGYVTSYLQRWSAATNTWSALGGGTNGNVYSLAALPGGDFIAAGGFSSAGGVPAVGIARWHADTGAWSALGSGVSGPGVNTVAALPGGDVIAGGSFSAVGGVRAFNIARWSVATGQWFGLGSSAGGSPGNVTSLAALTTGDVIAGGHFTSIAGVTAGNIAQWHAATRTWSPLGSGIAGDPLNASVRAAAVLPDGDVVVGGYFTTAGGAPVSNIARWSPSTSTWSPMGAGIPGASLNIIRAMALLPDGDVIVGGQFTSAGGIAAAGVARWTPSTNAWSTLGSGPGGNVYALAALPDGDVLAGGNFGGFVGRVMRWSSSAGTWTSVGTGWNGEVYALAALPSGDVLAGGTFGLAAGVSASNIARWTRSTNTWSAMDSGLYGPGPIARVDALAVLRSGDVIVAGGFAGAGAAAAANVARWNPATGAWSPLGAGTNAETAALATSPNGDVIAGGYFTTAGGNASAYFARWTTHPVCPADFNCSGAVSFQDLFDFLAAWYAHDPRSSIGHTGPPTVQDIFDFLAAWFAGCP